MAQIEAFTSPLPPPEIVAAYAQASPDAVGRMIALVEEEQRHRHTRSMALVEQQHKQSLALVEQRAIDMAHGATLARRAQILGFAASMAFLGVGVLLILMGQWQFGVSAFLLPMVMAMVPLMHGRRR